MKKTIGNEETVKDVGQVVSLCEERRNREVKLEDKLRKEEENLAFIEDIKEAVDAEYTLEKQGKSTYSLLKDITKGIFEKHIEEGAMMFTQNDRRAYSNSRLIEENTRRKSVDEYLIVTSNKILYVDIAKDVIKTMDLKITDINDIYVIDNGDVLIMNKFSTRYIIRSREFVDDKVANQCWQDVTFTDEEYKTVNFTIDTESIDIKIRDLYMLLKFGLAVMTTTILGSGSIYYVDNLNGIRSDNRISNLQLIPENFTGRKDSKGNYNKYGYALALKVISDEVERKSKDIDA